MNYDLCMKALSLMRYLTDHVPHISLGATNRILNIHDVPLVLVNIIEQAPWARQQTVNGKSEYETI